MSAKGPLKIAHITVCRDLPAGIRKQIGYEFDASRQLEGAQWTSLALHSGAPRRPFESQIPWIFRPILLRALYGWLVVLRLSRSHEFVLVRHMTFDPFALVFAPFIGNRISVHHSKEVEELPLIRPGFKGSIAAAVEQVTGGVAVRRALGVIGVTPEIAKYEVETRAPGKPFGSYANGISLDEVPILEDERDPVAISVVFIAETFSAWHGLDRLINTVSQAAEPLADLRIHLVGRLSESLQARIAALGARAPVFVLHGFLDSESYRKILAACDVGVGSLAMDRQRLREGSTLKVREMLASGLPVYSGHRDPSFPGDFPYYFNASGISVDALLRFAAAMKDHTRDDVRSASEPYIDKLSCMRRVVEWLRVSFADRRGG